MKSNLNIRILKFCIAEICLQIGFERISEQSLNILADVLKYYISQISNRINNISGIEPNFNVVGKYILSNFVLEDSYQEKELINFLYSYNTIRRHVGEDLLSKNLSMMANDQKHNLLAIKNLNENEKEIVKPGEIFTEKSVKDEDIKEFLNKCSTKYKPRNLEDYDFDVTHVIDEIKKKRSFFESNITECGEDVEIFNDVSNIFEKLIKVPKRKIFKNN